MFICNHCPYVKAIRERLVRDAADLAALGIGVVAISANDPADYPEDSFENMKRVAGEFHYPFAYLFDESQDVARAYGAVCTPDFSASTTSSNCSIEGAWMRRERLRCRARVVICSKP